MLEATVNGPQRAMVAKTLFPFSPYYLNPSGIRGCDHDAAKQFVRVSDDGRLAASGDVDGIIYVWDLQTKSPLAVLRGHIGAIYNLRFHNGFLYTASADRTIRQWDIDFETSPLMKSLRSLKRIP